MPQTSPTHLTRTGSRRWAAAIGLSVAIACSAAAASDAFTPDLDPDHAAPVRHSAPTFTVYFENDTFAGRDGHYTSGSKLSWTSGDLTTWGQQGWRRAFVEALPFVNRPGTHKNLGVALGQNIYTPQDISRVPPDPNDRPYVGWSYLEFSFVSKSPALLDTLSLQLGIVGPHSYADDVQRFVHEWLDDERPQGWDHQLADEPGVNLVYERKSRFLARASGGSVGFDVVPHIGFSVGNVQTYTNAGLTVRLGFNLPDDFGVGLIRPAGSNGGPLEDADRAGTSRRRPSLFLIGGVDGRAVARDLFLDGNTFEDGPRVEKEPFVGDAYYGVGVVLGDWQLTYMRAWRSREFKAQLQPNSFGSLAISRRW